VTGAHPHDLTRAHPHDVTRAPVRSPCVKLCVLDAAGLCEGCGRTLDEIATWSGADDMTREAVVARAAARLRQKGTSR
jgi:uncharacterized protein